MAQYTRNNAWNTNGTFGNPDLLWYAKGVGVMQARALDDPGSWWFFAAIHGQNATGSQAQFPAWSKIPGPPLTPHQPLPAPNVRSQYWDQCQHQSWFFPPWHRGYLIALEAHVRAAIIGLGGPNTWALPYWNYFGPNNQFEMPPAFAQATLPNGSANPLYVKARFGPHGNGNIFVQVPTSNQDCMSDDVYTGSSNNTASPGFGGPATGFTHFGGTSGNLEDNPHNLVHGDIGGDTPGPVYGLMADPDTAALDPIFYLHHCNIDRMWAHWNDRGNANPASPNWLAGPTAAGNRKFAVPMPGVAAPWIFTPLDVHNLGQLDYTYDDLPTAVPPPAGPNMLVRRLNQLGARPAGPDVAPARTLAFMETDNRSELVGANEGALSIKSSGARATVRLDANVRRRLAASLTAASAATPPDRAYLRLENVRGTRDAHKLNVYVNDMLAGTVGLFGLRKASLADGVHGGAGLTFLLDISNIIDSLQVGNTLDSDSLDVRIVPDHAIPDTADITVGRVSVYRETLQ